jgi:putative nucleotide binding protein
MSDSEREGEGNGDEAVVLDFLPHGRTADDRPQYEKEPLAYVLDVGTFQLSELVVDGDAGVSIGDRIEVDGNPDVDRVRRIDYDDLPGGAQSELEYAVADLVEAEEERFVDFYNDAQPITLRLHQLDLLPGVGKKIRNGVLDGRKRRPFEGFDDLEARVDGLHNPQDVLVERILEELREEDLKYRTFVRQDGE